VPRTSPRRDHRRDPRPAPAPRLRAWAPRGSRSVIYTLTLPRPRHSRNFLGPSRRCRPGLGLGPWGIRSPTGKAQTKQTRAPSNHAGSGERGESVIHCVVEGAGVECGSIRARMAAQPAGGRRVLLWRAVSLMRCCCVALRCADALLRRVTALLRVCRHPGADACVSVAPANFHSPWAHVPSGRFRREGLLNSGGPCSPGVWAPPRAM